MGPIIEKSLFLVRRQRNIKTIFKRKPVYIPTELYFHRIWVKFQQVRGIRTCTCYITPGGASEPSRTPACSLKRISHFQRRNDIRQNYKEKYGNLVTTAQSLTDDEIVKSVTKDEKEQNQDGGGEEQYDGVGPPSIQQTLSAS